MFGDEVAAGIAAPKPVDAGARTREAGLKRKSGVELADMQHRFQIVDGEAARAVLVSIKPGKAWNEGGQSADHADLPIARQHRRSFNRADKFHKARKAAAHGVGGEIVAIGAMLAEPGNRCDGEAGISFAQTVM